jgi:hypothetical protein
VQVREVNARSFAKKQLTPIIMKQIIPPSLLGCLSLLLLPAAAFADMDGKLTLQHSTDAQTWNDIEITPEMIDGDGRLSLTGVTHPSFFRLHVTDFAASQGREGITGPTFVTLSGVNTRFDFDTGQITEDASSADLNFWAHSFGNEFILHSFDSFSGTKFRPDSTNVANDREYAYHYYRTINETDWKESEGFSERIARNDTFLLKTSEGRFVKVFIIDVRGDWRHNDAPAVDFVYHFTNQVDNEPPILERITLMAGDLEISKPLSDVIEFDLQSIPEYLYMRLDFNEIVYRNRGFIQMQDNRSFSRRVWGSSAYPYYYHRPRLSDKFRGIVQISTLPSSPRQGEIVMEGAEDFSEFENANWTDEGFYFSDLAGNRWTDLPFSKIIIRFERE